MAQASVMGPPLSPAEPRRSGRRSAPFGSNSTSKSPDSDLGPTAARGSTREREKETSHRPQMTSSNSSGRGKRPKQEDGADDSVSVGGERGGHSKHGGSSNSSTHSASTTTNGRSKRKGKKNSQHSFVEDIQPPDEPIDDLAGQLDPEAPAILEDEDEEQGITRCICGSNGDEDNQDNGEFMVQCETCKVWQHGPCMGYESQEELEKADYYCELCRPDLHPELLKKNGRKKARQSSASHHNANRMSRSHSPTYLLKQPSKRRNTMNSAFDDTVERILQATAVEANTIIEPSAPTNGHGDAEDDTETPGANKGGRKRRRDDGDEESIQTKKRNRSASSVSLSEHPAGSLTVHGREESPSSFVALPPPPTSGRGKGGSRAKRGGGRKNNHHNHHTAPVIDPVEGVENEVFSVLPPPSKRGGRKGAASKRHLAVSGDPNGIHDPPGKRGANGSARAGSVLVQDEFTSNTGGQSGRAYRQSHAYVVSQQPLYSSWNLPDYLSHLEQMLPTSTPKPLEVRASGATRGGSVEAEKTTERGVKVKWPSKRMSVGDMNKRVRALVEWVGREQASALDRGRRMEALQKSMKEESVSAVPNGAPDTNMEDSPDGFHPEKPPNKTKGKDKEGDAIPERSTLPMPLIDSDTTMKIMEELMEELISFQERFGPSAKARERERKVSGTS